MTCFQFFVAFRLVESEERKEAEAFLKQAEFQPGLLPVRISTDLADLKKKPVKPILTQPMAKLTTPQN